MFRISRIRTNINKTLYNFKRNLQTNVDTVTNVFYKYNFKDKLNTITLYGSPIIGLSIALILPFDSKCCQIKDKIEDDSIKRTFTFLSVTLFGIILSPIGFVIIPIGIIGCGSYQFFNLISKYKQEK